jgi:hypothetical protein
MIMSTLAAKIANSSPVSPRRGEVILPVDDNLVGFDGQFTLGTIRVRPDSSATESSVAQSIVFDDVVSRIFAAISPKVLASKNAERAEQHLEKFEPLPAVLVEAWSCHQHGRSR